MSLQSDSNRFVHEHYLDSVPATGLDNKQKGGRPRAPGGASVTPVQINKGQISHQPALVNKRKHCKQDGRTGLWKSGRQTTAT